MASAVKRFVQQFKVTGRIWGARVRHAGMARPASVVGDSRQQQADRHHQLVLGFCSGISVLAQHGALQEQLQAYLDRPFAELSPVESSVLLAGAYELTNYPQTPYRVIINEAIELTKGYGGTDGHKYVNGVLDKLAAKLRPVEVEAKRAARKG